MVDDLLPSFLEIESSGRDAARKLHDMSFWFLTHPVTESIRNQISILLGEGGTLGFLTPIRDIKDVINHVNAQS